MGLLKRGFLCLSDITLRRHAAALGGCNALLSMYPFCLQLHPANTVSVLFFSSFSFPFLFGHIRSALSCTLCSRADSPLRLPEPRSPACLSLSFPPLSACPLAAATPVLHSCPGPCIAANVSSHQFTRSFCRLRTPRSFFLSFFFWESHTRAALARALPFFFSRRVGFSHPGRVAPFNGRPTSHHAGVSRPTSRHDGREHHPATTAAAAHCSDSKQGG